MKKFLIIMLCVSVYASEQSLSQSSTCKDQAEFVDMDRVYPIKIISEEDARRAGNLFTADGRLVESIPVLVERHTIHQDKKTIKQLLKGLLSRRSKLSSAVIDTSEDNYVIYPKQILSADSARELAEQFTQEVVAQSARKLNFKDKWNAFIGIKGQLTISEHQQNLAVIKSSSDSASSDGSVTEAPTTEGSFSFSPRTLFTIEETIPN